MQNKRKITYTITLIIAHLLIFNFLYVSRYDLNNTLKHQAEFNEGNFKGSAWNYLKLYYSHISDEAYYYEWSTVALGKNFDINYPFQERRGSSVSPYFNQTPRLQIPYLEIPSEYPPLLILPLLGIRLLSSSYLGFCHLLAAFLSMLYLATFYLVYRLNLKLRLNYSLNRLLTYSLLSILLLGEIFVTRLDIIPAFLYTFTIYLFLEKKWLWSALLIALGFYAKGFSIILFPFFAIIPFIKKEFKAGFIFSLGFLAIFSLLTLSIHYSTQGAYWEALRFHQSRGIQVESIYSVIPHLSNLMNTEHIFTYYGHNSANIHMQRQNFLLLSSEYLPFILFGLIYGLTFIKFRSIQKNQSDLYFTLQGAVLLLFSFILSFKVFSPQYLIWLIPIFYISNPRSKPSSSYLFLIALFCTQIFYPTLYFLLENAHPLGSFLLVIRNGILIILWVKLLKNWNLDENKSPSLS